MMRYTSQKPKSQKKLVFKPFTTSLGFTQDGPRKFVSSKTTGDKNGPEIWEVSF